MLYNPPHFRETDRAVLDDFIATAAFATLVTAGADGPIVSHLPMLLDAVPAPGGSLIGHVARANPQWRASDLDRPALAIFMGPQAYVSPSWYPSKAAHGKVVPTWNYAAVHVTGRLSTFDEPDALRALVDRLTATHEATFASPWRTTDAPDDFIRAQLKAIVGVRLEIAGVEGKMKLSQNRTQEDRAGVVDGLERRHEPAAAALAAMMRTAPPRP
ncbi:MAG: FMN-binding negative transcriptional regulator [Alphaproteobacteria bacterium]|nr:FMN-binding negative transcriptional regulator [Alphaproteobacteria bacterium]